MGLNNRPHGTRIEVECYAGYKAAERPVAFTLDAEKRVIEDIIDQWHGEDHTYFKVLADDHKVYILRYDHTGDFWMLIDVMERIGKH